MTTPPAKRPLQSRFPRLWLTFQYLACGYFDRGRYIRKHSHGRRRVLEIGCSLGMDSSHFADAPCDFLGVDIDPEAIAHAKKTHAGRAHMRFVCMDLHDLDVPEGERFDFILVSGVCHHVPTDKLVPLLEKAATLLAADGRLVVIDYAPSARPGWLERFFLDYDEGREIRSREALLAVLDAVTGLEIAEQEIFRNAAFVFPWPTMAYKFCIAMKKTDAEKGAP